MKGVFIVLYWMCFILFVEEVQAQVTELRSATYPDGTLRYQGYFKDGRPVGEMKRFYPDGKLQAWMNYRGDTTEVVLYSRKSEGQIKGIYVDRKKQGNWEYLKNDCLLVSEEYLDNLLNGKRTCFFSSGKTAEEKNWVAGVVEGEWKLFYDNGQLRMLAGLKGGKLDGAVKSYSYEGILRSEGHYKNDLKEGSWIFYDDQGKSIKKIVYHAGISENAEAEELEESRRLDALVQTGKKIPDPAVFSDDPEAYMKLTGME